MVIDIKFCVLMIKRWLPALVLHVYLVVLLTEVYDGTGPVAWLITELNVALYNILRICTRKYEACIPIL